MIPKYRAWDKVEKAMYKVETLHIEDEYVDLIDLNKNVADLTNTSHWRKNSDVILMQSTGLKDKNGVEIYQDDVVNMCWSDEIGESHWGKITIKNPFDYCIEEARYLIHADELEVIGNIYENPELLEGAKQ